MTSFSDIYEAFFEKMESDEDFFNYFDLTEEESMALARERAHTYLKESISIILRTCQQDETYSFADYDDDLEQFNWDLNIDEIDMLANLMYEREYRRQYSKLKAFRLQHLPTTLQAFSPANDRKTIQAVIEYIHEQNVTMLDNYKSTDRLTYKKKTIDYDSYASYSEDSDD